MLVKDHGYYQRNNSLAMVEGGREGDGEEYANWRVLRRICSDPYLESVRLRVGYLEERDRRVVDTWTNYEDVPLGRNWNRR